MTLYWSLRGKLVFFLCAACLECTESLKRGGVRIARLFWPQQGQSHYSSAKIGSNATEYLSCTAEHIFSFPLSKSRWSLMKNEWNSNWPDRSVKKSEHHFSAHYENNPSLSQALHLSMLSNCVKNSNLALKLHQNISLWFIVIVIIMVSLASTLMDPSSPQLHGLLLLQVSGHQFTFWKSNEFLSQWLLRSIECIQCSVS